MSSADQVLVRFVEEVTPGTTPVASANWKELPIVSESITAAPNYIESEAMNPTRNLQALLLAGNGASGSIDGELKATDWDDFIEAALMGTWATDVLKVGVVQRAYSIEKEFQDLTTYWNIATGMQVATMDLNVSYGAIATLSFGFEGFVVASAVTSAVGAGSSASATTTVPMEGSAGTVVNIDGAPVSGAIFRSFAMNVSNNLRPLEGMGTVGRDGIAAGSNSVTGTLEMYMADETKAYYNSLLAGTSHGIDVTITEGSQSYKFDVSAAKFTGGDPNATGRNTDVMLSLGFTGVYDATDASTLVVTRVT